jgi:hypothetical protein
MIVVTTFLLKLLFTLFPVLVKSKEQLIEESKLRRNSDDPIGMTVEKLIKVQVIIR